MIAFDILNYSSDNLPLFSMSLSHLQRAYLENMEISSLQSVLILSFHLERNSTMLNEWISKMKKRKKRKIELSVCFVNALLCVPQYGLRKVKLKPLFWSLIFHHRTVCKTRRYFPRIYRSEFVIVSNKTATSSWNNNAAKLKRHICTLCHFPIRSPRACVCWHVCALLNFKITWINTIDVLNEK